MRKPVIVLAGVALVLATAASANAQTFTIRGDWTTGPFSSSGTARCEARSYGREVTLHERFGVGQ
jgi:hypothetical protein